MPRIRIPAGYGQLFFYSTNPAGHRCSTTYGVVLDDVPIQSELNTLSSSFGVDWTNIIATTSAYVGCTLLIGQDGGAPTKMTSTSGTGAGGRGGAMCPPQVQAVLKKSSDLADRRGQGRNFSIDVLEGNVDNAGTITSTDLSLRTTFCTNMMGALVTGPFAGMVILHPSALVPTLVATYAPETKVATLRRRFPR